MNTIQLGFLPAHDSGCEAVGDWSRDQECLGTKIFLVLKLGTNKLSTKKISVPKSYKPLIGCLQQKLINGNLYWYWRYYATDNKKKSLYLAKGYSKAIEKAKLIGYPGDAKRPKQRLLLAPQFD
jgi:hypothetical protein